MSLRRLTGIVIVPEKYEKDTEGGEENTDAEVLVIHELFECCIRALGCVIISDEDEETCDVEKAGDFEKPVFRKLRKYQ
jgi:hypothetical protein